MKITNLKVSNFRNLKTIDVDFGNINILTGRNSTGKTNLTQLLTNCLNTNPSVESYFGKNITTYGAGLNQTSIETSIENNYYIFLEGKGLYNILEPIFKYKHIISKSPLYSFEQSIFFKGIEEKYMAVSDYINDKEVEIDNIELKEVYNKKFQIIEGLDGIIGNQEISIENGRYFKIFESKTKNSIINYDDGKAYSSCGFNIFNEVIERNKELGLEGVKLINSSDKKPGFSEFNIAKFISLLADVQKDKTQFKKFNDDLLFFTDGILREVKINEDGKSGGGSKGDISVNSPNGPKDIEFISAGTALILYFVVLKNWLDLDVKSYKNPDIMIFDELDSAIHPALIGNFSDLLKIISNKVQLFITTHSISFIDNFKRGDLYLLKDIGSFSKKVKVESNVMSYSKIINSLEKEEQKEFEKISNSELYVNGYIDTFFPII